MQPPQRIDYDKIAPTYDAHRHGGGPYLPRLVALATQNKHTQTHIVEIGAGTGQNTEAFLNALPAPLKGHLTAIEISGGMLSKAHLKPLDVHWVQAAAQQLPLLDQCADFLFGVYVLHHFPNLDIVFDECYRVLRCGIMAFVTASHEYIDRHPMNHYFPSFAKIDKARMQTIPSIWNSMKQVGFKRTYAETFLDSPKPIDAAYVERVANKHVSTYDLIPEAEFKTGLARLRSDVAKTGQLDIPRVWENVLVWGERV